MLFRSPSPASLGGVQQPVLLVACTQDPLVDQAWTGHLREVLPQAQVAELPHKHSPNVSHPEETWQVLEDFLAGVAGLTREGATSAAE